MEEETEEVQVVTYHCPLCLQEESLQWTEKGSEMGPERGHHHDYWPGWQSHHEEQSDPLHVADCRRQTTTC